MNSHSSNSYLMAMIAKKNYNSTKPANKPHNSGGQKSNRPYCIHYRIQGHSVDNCFKVGNAEPPLCTHCHMTGHTAERCYKLHGYLPRHKLHGKSEGFTVAANQSRIILDGDEDDEPAEAMALAKAQYHQLIALLQPEDTSSMMIAITIAQPSPTQSSNHVSASRVSGMVTCLSTRSHKISDPHPTPWIIDT